MVSKQFSFRLPDEAVQVLESLQTEGETLNQTAQRIMIERLGVSTVPSKTLSTITCTSVDRLDIKELVKQEIEASLNQVRSQLEAQLEELRGKFKRPVVEENSATGQPRNEDLTVANSQLQEQVIELQKRIRNQDEQLQKADELNQEMLELRPQYWLTTEELRIKREQLHQAETENQQLRQQLQTAGASVQPDYEATRDRVLAKLKMGRQSAAGKAIEAFIKELSTSKPL